jgi:hypothetical protein
VLRRKLRVRPDSGRNVMMPDLPGTAMFGAFIREIAVSLDRLETAGFMPLAVALRQDLWPQLTGWQGYPVVRVRGIAWGVLT